MSPSSSSPKIFEKGCIVILGGLQSEAGQRLNGGHGLILSDKPLKDGRYPIRVFAISKTKLPSPRATAAAGDCTVDGGPIILDPSELKLLENPEDKKLKIQNITLHPSPETNTTFFEGGNKYIMRAHQRNDYDAVIFLSQAYYKAFPSEYGAAITGVNFLREKKKDYKTASDTMYKIIQESPLLENVDHPLYGFYLHDTVLTFVRAREHIEEASDYAHRIPTDTDRNLKLSNSSLLGILHEADDVRKTHGEWAEEHKLWAKLAVRATKTLYDRNTDPDLEFDLSHGLAGAYFHAGDYWDSVKQHRWTLQRNDVPADKRPSVIQGLIEAQMKCPGMPLEHLTIVGRRDNPVELCCVRNIDVPNTHTRVHDNDDGDMVLAITRPPTDPDDEVFTPLLEKLRFEGVI